MHRPIVAAAGCDLAGIISPTTSGLKKRVTTNAQKALLKSSSKEELFKPLQPKKKRMGSTVGIASSLLQVFKQIKKRYNEVEELAGKHEEEPLKPLPAIDLSRFLNEEQDGTLMQSLMEDKALNLNLVRPKSSLLTKNKLGSFTSPQPPRKSRNGSEVSVEDRLMRYSDLYKKSARERSLEADAQSPSISKPASRIMR